LWLLFESDYYSRVVFVELVNTDRMEDEEINYLKEGGVAADTRESI